jgi:arylsulfatase A-like enzyme
VVDALLERLPEGARGPLFLYSHIIDPHAPYDRGGRRGSLEERYAAEVSIVDAQIGRLRSEIARRGLDRSLYLFVTADHAEAFGEHGHFFHSTTVYEEMIRIPLLIEGPGVKPRRAARTVTLLDLYPTVLSMFGLQTPGHVMGQSLVPFMRGETPVLTRPLAVDSGRAVRAMLFQERWKAIADTQRGTEEVYDLREDPQERKNLAERPEAQAYLSTLHAFFAALNAPAK